MLFYAIVFVALFPPWQKDERYLWQANKVESCWSMLMLLYAPHLLPDTWVFFSSYVVLFVIKVIKALGNCFKSQHLLLCCSICMLKKYAIAIKAAESDASISITVYAKHIKHTCLIKWVTAHKWRHFHNAMLSLCNSMFTSKENQRSINGKCLSQKARMSTLSAHFMSLMFFFSLSIKKKTYNLKIKSVA